MSLPWRFLLLVTLCTGGLNAQWLNFRTPGVPRTKDGKPNLSAPAPRVSGKPDFSGVWHVQPTPLAEMKRRYGQNVDALDVPGMEADTISRYAVDVLQDFKPEESPLRPAAMEIFKQRLGQDLPSVACLPLGLPLNSLLSEPIRIVQSPNLIAILYEADDKHRRIYMDGRTLPKEFDQPAWLGYSVAKWDHDTLVIETAGFNDKSSLDIMGHPHSEAMRLTERLRRRDFGHIDAEMTFDDPQMYTKPFSIKVTYELQADSDIFEYQCAENEKDRAHTGQR